MRRWLSPLAYPNKNAAYELTTRPMSVRTLGLMCERASRWTMASSRTPQARPTPLVQLIVCGSFRLRFRAELGQVVNGRELEDFHFTVSVGRHDHRGVANFLVEQGPSDGRVGRNFPVGHVGFFGGHDVVFDLGFFKAVVNLHRRTKSHFVLGDVVHVRSEERRVGK